MPSIMIEEYEISISDSAQEFLTSLLEKQDDDVIGVRLYIDQAGTPKAETLLTYHRAGSDDPTILYEFEKIKAFVDTKTVKFLHEATVNYDPDNYGGSLTIKAPNSKLPKLGHDASLEERVNYVLWNDVNPGIAAHGGECSLVEITEEKVVILSFGGGCQGCSQVDATLKYGVETQLLAAVPELTGIRDVTDHSDTTNAFY